MIQKLTSVASILIVMLVSCKNESNKTSETNRTEITKIETKKTDTSTNAPSSGIIAKGLRTNIEKDVMENTNFRKVVYTTKNIQLVIMSLKPNEIIEEEAHFNIDQLFRFESGIGQVVIDGNTYHVTNGDLVIIPAGLKHTIRNIDNAKDLKFYTVYCPPKHKDKLIHINKNEAQKNAAEFDGKISD
jgi:mannose-6-phosphate isomerase-like protein (cupin superfamily)